MKKKPKKSSKKSRPILKRETIKKPPAKAEVEKIKKTKIRMIGIGGGAGAIVSEIAARMPRATFVAANTDLKSLKTISRKVVRFPFGQNFTHGLGTGMNVSLGREAALAEKDKIKNLLSGQDLCILVVCLGGGTGSGALPVFAKIARKMGNLTYGIFTLPFKFEGEKKMEIARESLKKVRNYLNAFSVIPNERVFQIINKETPLKQSLSIINKMLSKSLAGLIETIYEPGLINIDFADFKTILEGRGRLVYLNTVEIQRKKGQSQDLITEALNSPLYPYSIRGAKGVLFNIAGEKELSLADVNQISKTIADLINPEAKIIFGVSQSQRYSDMVKITLLASGCGLKIFSAKRKKKRQPKIKEKIIKKSPRKRKKKPSPIKPKPPRRPKKAKRVRKKIKKQSEKTKPLKIKRPRSKPKKKQRKKQRPVSVSRNEAKNQSQNNSEETIRKNAIQIKKEAEELEKEMVEKEQFWETPAFLRKKIS